MIKRFKNKINKKIDLRVEQLKSQEHENAQIQFNYSQLQNLFGEPFFLPMTTWSISPSTILHAINDICINNRQNIVEFGSGASTFYIAKLIKSQGLKTTFYTVESNTEWMEQMINQLKLYNLEDFVKFIYAPITNVPKALSFNEQKTWYDTKILNSKLSELDEIDLILVDGPLGGSTPFARYTAIPFLVDRLSKDCCIFLDDIHRAKEKEIALQWAKKLHLNPEFIERYAYFNTNKSFETKPFQLS